MKLIWILCLCFVSFHLLVDADDEPTQPTETTQSNAESTTTLASDVTGEVAAPTNSDHDTVSGLGAAPAADPTVETTPVTSDPTSTTTEAATTSATKEINSTQVLLTLSEQIKTILDHFQKENPVGFPGQDILPDPLPAPNVTEGLGIFSSSEFYNNTVHGLSQFTVESVNMMLSEMTFYVQIRIKDVQILGNYTQNSFASLLTTKGPYNLTLTNVTAEGIVYLVVQPDGSLLANRSVTSLTYKKVAFHLGENSSAPLSGVVDAAGGVVIGTILPFIKARIDERLTNEVNKKLKDSPPIPAIRDISPADLLILKTRDYAKKHFDPYTVQNVIKYDTEFFYVTVGPVSLRGLSNFARVGDISLGMVNRTMVTKVRIITGKINGTAQFLINLGKVRSQPERQANFSVEHLQFEATIQQSVDTKQKPQLADLQLEMGTLQLKLDNQGNFDYLIELAIRMTPDYLRYYLLDVLEEPIKKKIQTDIMNEVNVDAIVDKSLPLLDKFMQENKV